MKDKFITIARWLAVLPGALLGSIIVYFVFFYLNKASDYSTSSFDNIWNYGVMFVSHAFMGATFVYLGVTIAPSRKKACACVLFAISCMVGGIALFATYLSGFSWISFISAVCLLLGSGYVFKLCISEIDNWE